MANGWDVAGAGHCLGKYIFNFSDEGSEWKNQDLGILRDLPDFGYWFSSYTTILSW